MNRGAHNYWIIWATLFIGFLFQIIPWPPSVQMLKPHWLMLILIYWILALPHRVGISTAFFTGILLDLFSGTVLGVHALIFSVIAYLAIFRFQLLRNLALWQQSFVILCLSTTYNVLLLILQIAIYQIITISPLFFLSALTDSILWLGVYLLLRQLRRGFAVS